MQVYGCLGFLPIMTCDLAYTTEPIIEVLVMKSNHFLSLCVAAAFSLPGLASAAGYYVVTPNPGKQATVKPPEISVTLASGTLAEAKLKHAYTEDLKPYLSVTGDSAFQPTDVSLGR
ncbi:hypothetical protein CS343_04605 [Bordetella bronchiseptica]|nr:hypothetical protein CS343_04605 [Bordetella bronchiseptica]